MAVVVEFTEPFQVRLVEESLASLPSDGVRVETISSGISAGTELTAYRGTNPYINNEWDVASRIFRNGTPSFAYPVRGWGYSEVGRILEVGSDVSGLRVGDRVWGIWGHRSHAVLSAAALEGHVLPDAVPSDAGLFARVGAIAYNAVIASRVKLNENVVVFGQGVIGLLCTRLLALSGANVIAVDLDQERLEMSQSLGAQKTFNAASKDPDGLASELREYLGGKGADSAVEFSGSYRALHEAIRSVNPGGLVVASGFYQGGATDLRLGEEFHHNRVELVSSQIGGAPSTALANWTVPRLQLSFMDLVAKGKISPQDLVTHRFPASEVQSAFELIDKDRLPLQVVLDFEGLAK